MANHAPLAASRVAIALEPSEVRALDLSVTRLDQTYRRVDDLRYDYTSEGGDFRAVVEYDAAGLIVDYPGIAVRFA